MCGVTGLWQLDGAPVERSVLQAMTDAIAHRGPDGEGLLVAGSLGLGQFSAGDSIAVGTYP